MTVEYLLGYDVTQQEVGKKLAQVQAQMRAWKDGTIETSVDSFLELLNLVKDSLTTMFHLASDAQGNKVKLEELQAMAEAKAKIDMLAKVIQSMQMFSQDKPDELKQAMDLLLPKLKESLNLSDLDKTIQELKGDEEE